MNEDLPLPATVPVSGVWLRRIGDRLHVLAEINEEWRLVVSEQLSSDPELDGLGSVSHIAEVGGILSAPKDSRVSSTTNQPPIKDQ